MPFFRSRLQQHLFGDSLPVDKDKMQCSLTQSFDRIKRRTKRHQQQRQDQKNSFSLHSELSADFDSAIRRVNGMLRFRGLREMPTVQSNNFRTL